MMSTMGLMLSRCDSLNISLWGIRVNTLARTVLFFAASNRYNQEHSFKHATNSLAALKKLCKQIVTDPMELRFWVQS